MRDSLGRPMTARVQLARTVRIHLLSALLIACTSGNGDRHARVDTSLVYVQSGPWHDFPQVSDSNRTLRGGSLLPDPKAPACVSPTLPDTQSWSRSSNVLSDTKGFYVLSLRLPHTFVPVSAPGRWESRAFGSSLHLFLGPSKGYPSTRYEGGDPRQLQFRECKFPTPLGPLAVASFTVEWSGTGNLPTYYVTAHGPLTLPDTAVLVIAEAHDSVIQADIVAALQTMTIVFERP